jgi:hypothetical protein
MRGMNRRGFLRSMLGGLATAAAVRAFPFRVFSFHEARRLMDPGTASNYDEALWMPMQPVPHGAFAEPYATELAHQGRFFRNGNPFQGRFIQAPAAS